MWTKKFPGMMVRPERKRLCESGKAKLAAITTTLNCSGLPNQKQKLTLSHVTVQFGSGSTPGSCPLSRDSDMGTPVCGSASWGHSFPTGVTLK